MSDTRCSKGWLYNQLYIASMQKSIPWIATLHSKHQSYKTMAGHEAFLLAMTKVTMQAPEDGGTDLPLVLFIAFGCVGGSPDRPRNLPTKNQQHAAVCGP